jgi:hypothetical protein
MSSFTRVFAKVVTSESVPHTKTEELVAPVWVPDKESPNCMVCNTAFTVIKRRHHCRRCGKVICGECSANKSKLPNLGVVRVCDDCFEELGGTLSKSKAKRRTLFLVKEAVFTKSNINITIAALSDRLLGTIFGFLDIETIIEVALVCKNWNKVAMKDKVWRSLFLQRWNPPDLIHQKTWKQRYRIELNWEQGNYSVQTLKGHTSAISTILLDGNHIISGSVDTKINVFYIFYWNTYFTLGVG